MSFSLNVKQELCKIKNTTGCCKKAELAGIISFCGKFLSSNERCTLRIRTENFDVALKTQELFKEIFGFCENITERAKKNGASTFTIYIYEQKRVSDIVRMLGFFAGGIPKFVISPFLIHEECCKRAYLRGAFLGGGSVTSPDKGYHFEIETTFWGLSRDLNQLFSDEEIPIKTIKRKSSYVTYIKESDQIADMISLMGATDSMFEFYNVKMEKNMKNKVNRRVNCEVANIHKISDASAKQIHAIKKIMARKDSELPEQLKEIASLRLEYPEASLKELGEMLNPPISKSGVNHRLSKLIEIAEKNN